VREAVADGLRQVGFCRDFAQLLAQPRMQLLQQRCRTIDSLPSSLVRWSPPDVGLYFVQLADTLERLLGHRAARALL
jgi:hypothetical protein